MIRRFALSLLRSDSMPHATAGSQSDDDVMVMEEGWESKLRSNSVHKVACEILEGRKYGSPSIEKMRELLLGFVGPSSSEYFRRHSEEAKSFDHLARIVKNTSNRVAVSTRNKT